VTVISYGLREIKPQTNEYHQRHQYCPSFIPMHPLEEGIQSIKKFCYSIEWSPFIHPIPSESILGAEKTDKSKQASRSAYV
jgi:hypothetical protein